MCAARTHGRYDDRRALEGIRRACDAVTYEFENVPECGRQFLAAIDAAQSGRRALASPRTGWQKRTSCRPRIATAPFAMVHDADDAAAAFAELGGPLRAEDARLGYDGKGQAGWQAPTRPRALSRRSGVPMHPGRLRRFAFEASVVAARGADGTFAAYDPPKNVHENHILRRSTVPAPLSPAQSADAESIARRIAEALDYVGVLAVELFVARGRRAARQRDRAARAQFRPLDHRSLRRQPVRAAYPRRRRLAAGRCRRATPMR